MFFTQRFLSILALVGMANAFSGDATYYAPGLGACGRNNQASDHVVALSVAQYGNGENCFKSIGVNYQGKYVEATVVDKCEGCGPNDIDLSPSAFTVLASEDVGRIQVTWDYL
ncbi:riboflavine-aldehyde-forming enzyme [Laccaria bicolor S238N-H82]|uniref:Riboflavine-aldehyde-forming enzyme n=1 Tax=Laccaria bicolor (strain S238N-H82 / ATCC MYA-4686) TaxID=486041 RepID=B0E158_LACBS|nr:riboflavine-aldehyde-forming enzyme [Laccaria bicolor S238N-H82]EDQ99399.1 riboflavine-aldehyde-forming enzyme [Laccaria bicolor S238N-H82]|eukprot:XP_001889950.1 riboflavine-aldehyde-forming enzyme [Laccaria bicolor S238N-H82]